MGDDAEEARGDEGIAALIARLVEDARAFGRAELGYFRALATVRLRAARTALILLAAALVLAPAVLVVLLVGLVFTLAPIIGPGFATAIVVLVFATIAGLLGWLGYRRVRALFKATE